MINALNFYLRRIIVEFYFWSVGFLNFWLYDYPKKVLFNLFNLSVVFENNWAMILNVKNLFSPLFQDRSVIGRIIGPFFRLIWSFFGLLTHIGLLIFELMVFLIFITVFWSPVFLFVIKLFF